MADYEGRAFVPHALSLPTCLNLWRKTTAYQARMGPRMAENRQSSTRPYDDVVVICRGMRQSVVKALTSDLGLGCVETPAELRSLHTCDVSGRDIGDRPKLGSEYHLEAHKGVLGLL